MIARLRSFLVLFVFLFASMCASAAPAGSASFDFDSIPLAQLVRLVYLQAYPDVSYTVDPQLLLDNRVVSLRWSAAQGDFRPFFASYLAGLGYAVVTRNKVDSIIVKPAARLADVDDPSKDIFIYKPKYREGSYLVDLLSPLFNGHFVGQRKLGIDAPSTPGAGGSGVSPSPEVATPGSLLDHSNRKPDQLIFVGSAKEVASLSKLLEQVDTPVGEVVVKAYMYEVGSTGFDGSALKLVLSALGGKVQVLAGSDPVSNLVRLKTGSIDLVASALSTDARFKIVTAPYQRVKSGKSARFVSGSQVSVLGSVVTNQNGTTQQSYDRIESGTILEISPVVRDEVVDVDLYQQVSSFVKSDISAQPTLNKRELRSSLSVRDGEIVVIAGLEDSKDEQGKSGLSFLPFSLSKSKTVSKSQLVLILELKKI